MEYTIFRAEDSCFVPVDVLTFASDAEAIAHLQTLGIGYHAEIGSGGGCRIVSLPQAPE
jgi:hypothetical protein